MADVAISGLTALGAAPATNDLLVLVDVSDTTQAPTGTTKNMTVANLFTSPTATGSITITGGTVTVSTPVLNTSQTWNAGGVAFTALKLNVTNTASAAASLLMDLQVAGVSQFKVDGGGALTILGAASLRAVTAAGTITAALGIQVTGSAGVINGAISKRASEGLLIAGITGATNDYTLVAPGAATIMAVPTGTVNVVFSGGVTALSATVTNGSATAVARLGGTGASTAMLAMRGAAHANDAVALAYLSSGVGTGDLAFYANSADSASLSERGRITSGGILAWGTTVTTSASAGEIVLPNNLYLRGVQSGGGGTNRIIGRNGSNFISVDPDGNGAVFGGTITLPLGAGTGLVSIGAVDSGGAGFRVLRVPN